VSDAQELLTAAQVASRLGVSSSAVHAWARKGYIRHIRLPGERGRLRFRVEDIDAYLETNGKAS
jgi:excisionase family DNA binding protein